MSNGRSCRLRGLVRRSLLSNPTTSPGYLTMAARKASSVKDYKRTSPANSPTRMGASVEGTLRRPPNPN